MDMIDAAPPALAGGDATGIVITMPPLDAVARRWPVLEPILRRCTDRVRGFEPIDIFRLVMLGRMNLFLIREAGKPVAVVVTEVREFPRCRVLEVPFIAGTGLRRWWQQLLDVLDAHGEANGCVDLVGWDRKGWSHFGFQVAGAVLMRRLRD